MSAINFGKIVFCLAFALLLFTVAACGPSPEKDDSPFEKKQVDAVLAIDIDYSGSFVNHLDTAWAYCLRLLETFFRGREGMNDVIIISQISGSPNSILFTGSPSTFKTKLKSKDDFKRLFHGLDSNQSRVHSSLADTIHRVMRYNPKKSLIVALTDMVDNEPGSLPKLQEALRRYGKDGKAGNIALYWLEPSLVDAWKNQLSVAVKYHDVLDKDEEPGIPRFDD